MSRSVSVWYTQGTKETDIDVNNRELLGTQSLSIEFWRIKKLQDLGLKELIILGRMDPVGFAGWEDLGFLENEIKILEKHREQIDFYQVLRDRWIENLRYCFDKLLKTAPKDSIPHFMIG